MSIKTVATDPEHDRQLAARAAAGEMVAFEELVRSHQDRLFSFLYRMCRNRAEAEEMAQETFVKAWQGLSGFRGEASFRTWLFRIAQNLCINRLSRVRKTEPLNETLAARRDCEPEEAHRQLVRRELVTRALGKLPPDQRAALVFSIYDEMRYNEIAEAMGTSPAAVNSLLYRARMSVRKALAQARDRGVI